MIDQIQTNPPNLAVVSIVAVCRYEIWSGLSWQFNFVTCAMYWCAILLKNKVTTDVMFMSQIK